MAETPMAFTRYLYPQINWDNRLIIIRGAKGVGKTTLIFQHIKKTYANPNEAMYASLDNIWFGSHTLIELVEYLYTHGVKAVFLDEVHKYPNWRQEVKNIYDSYPGFKLVITGSSMLQLTSSAIGDLSRRTRLYTMEGLSFREFLELSQGLSLPILDLDSVLELHVDIAGDICQKIKILPLFEEYVQFGYYPFYLEEGDGLYDRIGRMVDTILEQEIPSISGIEYSSVYKMRQLLSVLAEQSPYTLNLSLLSKDTGISRDVILKLFKLMNSACLVRSLYSANGYKRMAKPEKILFDNSTLMYALSPNPESGTVRETFFASQLSHDHEVIIPNKGDMLIDNKWLFEVGGKKKGYKQIADIENSYVVADQIEYGFGNKIPIWMFGLLY
ncbi:MAG: AAA family ATPase [Bacteroidales bacterium]|nr:AAA family ATPase [Bacteroidales bacterium]